MSKEQVEAPTASHEETLSSTADPGFDKQTHDEALARTMTAMDVIELTTESPYREINFWGTITALCLGACAAFSSFSMPATALSLINDSLGPSASINWVAMAWTLTTAVGYPLVGRLSDIFGRRWFFAGCSAIGTIGCIVGATAPNVNALIGASVLNGAAASGQISFTYVVGELVPVKHRFAFGGFIFASTFPFGGLGAYLARLLIVNTSAGWRNIFYLSIALNGASTACWIIFYHPPVFESLHKGRTKLQEIRDLDIGGIFLYTAGMLLFLLGLSWGGGQYAWSSGRVIATMVIGVVTLIAFVLYETLMPLRRPIIPMHLFKNYRFVCLTTISAVGGMIYYSMNVIFPVLVAVLLTSDVVDAGLISSAVGGGVCAGEFLFMIASTWGGHLKWKLVFVTVCLTAFISGVAGATENKATAAALATLGGVSVGGLELLCATLITIIIDDQSEMGCAIGVYGSIRSAAGVIATAVYVAILDNRVASNITSIVVPDIIKAGLPTSSVEALITALSSGSTAAVEAVPGITTQTAAAGAAAYQAAYSSAFKTVFLASISFGGVAIIAALLYRETEGPFSHDVVRRLDGGKHMHKTTQEVEKFEEVGKVQGICT